MRRMSTNESVINVTQLLQLTDLEICETDINWSKVKMNSFRWIAVRHNKISFKFGSSGQTTTIGLSQSQMSLNSESYYPHLFNASFRNNHSFDDLHNIRDSYENNNSYYSQNSNGGTDSATIETVITVVNPFTKQLYNCQTGSDTKCAQISPDSDMIAISNDRFLAVYCVQTNKCLNTLPFPSKCLFWNWINNNLIAIITEREVFHWNIDYPFEPQLKFKVDQKLKDCQITGYKCDQTNELWFAITSLYSDEEDEINGLVQIYSDSYQLCQSIEAHACTLSQYKFNANQSSTPVLLAAKRTQLNTFKIYIIELGPIQEGNCSLISRTEVISQVDSSDCDDFPVSIEFNTELGLIYLFSKYGSLYICDIETGALIISAPISPTVIFTTCFDASTQTVLAIGRSGQLLAIDVYVEYLLRHLLAMSKKDVAQRIQSIINSNISKYNISDEEDCDEVTRL